MAGRKLKTLWAYLRIVANPADEVSAERALATPRRGVGDTSWMRLVQFSVKPIFQFLTLCCGRRKVMWVKNMR